MLKINNQLKSLHIHTEPKAFLVEKKIITAMVFLVPGRDHLV